MTTSKCRANNPSNCRYHGSIHVHRKQLQATLDNYKEVMVEQLRAGRVTPEMRTLVQNASDSYWDAMARVDSHASEFATLKSELEALDYAKEGEDPDSLDEGFKLEYVDTVKRIERAAAIRAARNNEDNPHGLGYVAESPHNLNEAKRILNGAQCGEFTGVHAGAPSKDGRQTLTVAGTEGFYNVTTDGEVIEVGSLKATTAPETPAAVRGNPALLGVNLRWKKNWETIQPTSPEGNKTTKLTGYTVYSDTESIIVDPNGVVRQRSTLLSLQ